jgi:serine/threonine-protein kinase
MILTENTVVADRFKLARMIGQGGMGSVWQATDLRLSTQCALKFIEGELANMAEAQARFQREAQAAAQLRSPHVVQIFDHGVWQGHPYIAMELLDGEDLGKRIASQGRGNGGRLSLGVVNAVVQQVCRALSKAHAAGVVHRDLKPDNIFLVTDDDREIVKILDFGVAKSSVHGIDGSNTKTGAMLGTPYYMSPEQAQGIKTVDSRSDLWSLAIIVFQCLTGRLPFESEALGDLLVKIIVNPIPVPSTFHPALPKSFDEWWGRAADRNPDHRFQTAKAFAESLAVALGQAAPADMNDLRHAYPSGMMAAVSADAVSNALGAGHTAVIVPPTATPSPHDQALPTRLDALTTNHPVSGTFSGLDPAAGVPKKGVPAILYVGIGLLAVVGVGLGGAALFAKGRSAHAATDKAPPAVVTSSPVETPHARAVAPPPVDSAASKPVESAASAVPVPSASHKPAPPAGRPSPRPAPQVAPSPTGAVAAPATKGKEKPINLGF